MAIKQIDMHAHTTASDGSLSPKQLVELAAKRCLAGVAITDHDTTAGIDEAKQAAQEYGITLLPGIEISTYTQGKEVHVLGYFMNVEDEKWRQRIASLGATRDTRNQLLIHKLSELGIEISLDELIAIGGDNGSIGRPHFAQLLINKGFVTSKQEAFDRYLGDKGKAYVQPNRIEPATAFEWIREAGGVSVLAHPGLIRNDQLVEQLLAQGPDGIEVNHSEHSEQQVEKYKLLARRFELIETAGSDFHNHASDSYHGELGSVTADYSVYERLFILHQQRLT